jgi:hypothetical protein
VFEVRRSTSEVVKDYLMAGRMDFDFVSAALKALHRIGHELKGAGEEFTGQNNENKAGVGANQTAAR